MHVPLRATDLRRRVAGGGAAGAKGGAGKRKAPAAKAAAAPKAAKAARETALKDPVGEADGKAPAKKLKQTTLK